MYTSINKHNVLTLLYSFGQWNSSWTHTEDSRRIMCCLCRILQCSVSVPSQDLPSALRGLWWLAQGISDMLDLCTEPARIPNRSTNALQGYPDALRGKKKPICNHWKFWSVLRLYNLHAATFSLLSLSIVHDFILKGIFHQKLKSCSSWLQDSAVY